MTHIKTHIKRGAAFLLCLCMALSLCACGGKGGEDTEAGALPKEEGKKTAPPSDGPLPLSQYIQSSETQILYRTNDLDKDTRPTVYLFQDGTVFSVDDFTFGELSKMSDEEIIQAVMSAEESPECRPCAVYLETDSTGNNVKQETLIEYKPLSQSYYTTVFEMLYPDSGVIYDSTYTGYWNSSENYYYAARGEQAPFVLDDIGAEDVAVDPSKEDLYDLVCSIAWLELFDGTRVSLQDVPAEGGITSCVLTGSGQRTLSLDDVQFTLPFSDLDGLPVDFSPSYWLTPEGRTAVLARGDWFSEFYGGGWGKPLPPIPAHRKVLIYSELDMYGSIVLYNATDTEQEVQNLTLGRISIDTRRGIMEGRTGPIEDSYNFLIQEYGPPSGAVMEWEPNQNRTSYPKAKITYYWAGDGFYLRLTDKFLCYEKSGLSEQDLKTLVGSEDGTQYSEAALRRCMEINRLLAD